MEITCEHCKTKLNIPDEKIPKNKALRISCPKCKKRMTLDTPKAAPKDSENDKYGYGDYTDDEALTFYEEGTKLALVMDNNPEQSEKIKTAVEQLGYNFISAPNTRDAIGRMRFHHFDLIILSDGFDGQGLENSPVLNYLNNISMSVRRRVFVALVGERFKTMDNMMAFAMSANVVINTKEQDKLSAILKRAISDNEKFYKVFMDTLVEAGKA
ncbi:MAG: zinc-ribbon domain-containing protein [Deltaproteobacteria bacterium]|nr:MAG: zinc-ribbon domain-containing protein [Deltaproteobacteria bacterium]